MKEHEDFSELAAAQLSARLIPQQPSSPAGLLVEAKAGEQALWDLLLECAGFLRIVRDGFPTRDRAMQEADQLLTKIGRATPRHLRIQEGA